MRTDILTATLMASILQAGTTSHTAGDNWSAQREAMTRTILVDVHETTSYTGRNSLDSRVIAALRKVPRHQFVPDEFAAAAYFNRPLPIGEGQTISQPFIVALMTDLLVPEAEHRVLEIGTGSGYQAAVLAELVAEVHSVEIIPELAVAARDRLRKLRYLNVQVHTGNGFFGWPGEAPYDSIIVTAASEQVPPALLEQLKPNGRLVIPLGPRNGFQQLVLIEKSATGRITRHNILPVQFVPFTGQR